MGLKIAARLLIMQLALATVISFISWVVQDSKAAYSAMLGGLVATIPNVFFAFRLFGKGPLQSAQTIVNSLYRGEALKLVTTILLLILVFRFISVAAMPFFITYCLTLMVFWVFLRK